MMQVMSAKENTICDINDIDTRLDYDLNYMLYMF